MPKPPLIGHTEPRVYTKPLRKLTRKTSLGFAFKDFCDELGVPLLPWQEWFAIHALELLPNGNFRFRTLVLLVARQNGKSTLAQMLALFFMYILETPLILSTAQSLDIAEEVWQGGVEMAQDSEELRGEIVRVAMANGKKQMELTNGSRWKVQAATRKGGRGLSGDLVMLDELREHTSWAAWSAISKTTMARDNALVFALSNAGDISSVVLAHLRKQAHKAAGDPDGLNTDPSTGEPIVDAVPDDIDIPEDDSVGLFEWSATPGKSVWDREGWQQANPSLGHTITERAIASACASDPEWTFRTEVLCQWYTTALSGPFPAGSWAYTTDPESALAPDADVCYGIDTNWDRTVTYVAVAGRRPDGKIHAEVIAARAGNEWVISFLESPDRKFRPSSVLWQTAGAPISGLTADLELSSLPTTAWGGSDLTRGTGRFYDTIKADDTAQVFHRPQPALDIAANSARTRPAGDAWLWDRARSEVDISPLIALNAAVWGILYTTEAAAVSAYDSQSSGLVLL